MQPIALIASGNLLQGVLFGAVMTILFGMILSWSWMLQQLWLDRPLLPAGSLVRRRETPFGAGTVVLTLLVCLLVGVIVGESYVLATRTLRGSKQAVTTQGKEPLQESDQSGKTPVRIAEARDTAESFSTAEALFVQTAAYGILLILLPVLARATSGARLHDLGLALEGWKRQVAVGLVAFLIAAPIVYGIQLIAVTILKTFKEKPKSHPVQDMLQEQFSGKIAFLAVVSAVIMAPLLEELLFRGILQQWLIRQIERFRRVWIGLHSPVVLRLPDGRLTPESVFQKPEGGSDFSSIPPDPPLVREENGTASLVTDEKSPSHTPSEGFTANPATSRLTVEAAIGLTSFIFASMHAAQWPAPIPLFALSVIIGVIYYRTGSLITAIIMHAAFNGFSTLFMSALLSGGGADKVKAPAEPVSLERKVVETGRHFIT
jgi:membrane protease YdiL (CAAX protease family)